MGEVRERKGTRRERRETKMSGLYREEQPRGKVCQVGTEGCWENLEARSALVCKICTSAPYIGSETQQQQKNGVKSKLQLKVGIVHKVCKSRGLPLKNSSLLINYTRNCF